MGRAWRGVPIWLLRCIVAVTTLAASLLLPGTPEAGESTPARVVGRAPGITGGFTPRPVAAPASRSRQANRPISVVALGDSVIAGTACRCVAYVDLYAEALRRRLGVAVQARNLGAPAQTSADVLAQLSPGGTASVAVSSADVVVLTIGANDFAPSSACDSCADTAAGYAVQLRSLRGNLVDTLGLVKRLGHGHPARVLLTGYWNVWLDGAVASRLGNSYVRLAAAVTQRTNAVLAAVAAASGARYVDLFSAFKGAGDRDDTALLADDGDHPSAAGHQLIANALVAASRDWSASLTAASATG